MEWILDSKGRPIAPAADNTVKPRPAGPWDSNKEKK